MPEYLSNSQESTVEHTADNEPTIAVAMSGGGVRATLFSLGACLYLDSSGLRRNVRMIASVSGGSITNAVLATSGDFARMESEEIKATARRFARALAKEGSFFFPGWRWFLLTITGLLPSALAMPLYLEVDDYWAGLQPWLLTYIGVASSILLSTVVFRSRTQRRVYGRVLARATANRDVFLPMMKRHNKSRLSDLRRSSVTHVLCATELHSGRPLYMSREWVHSPAYGWGEPHIGLKEAIYASAAFPAAFPPLRVDSASLMMGGGTIAQSRPRRLLLADGGVFNNLGTDWFEDIEAAAGSPFLRDSRYPIPVKCDVRLIINASAPPRVIRMPRWPRRSWVSFLRIMTILYENTVRPRVDALIGPPPRPGVVVVDIASTPLQQAREFAAHATDDSARERAREMVESLEGPHSDYWDDLVEMTSLTKTQLSAIGEEASVRLLRHGYLSALVACHCLLGAAGLEALPDERWFADLLGDED